MWTRIVVLLKKIDKKKLRVLALIGLPVVLVTLVLMWNNLRMLEGITESVNTQEHIRTTQAIDSAFTSLGEQMAITVGDNANWNEAYTKAFESFDMPWVEDTWILADDKTYYDQSFVLTSAGDVLFSNNRGKPMLWTAKEYYGHTLESMLAAAPKNNSEFEIIFSTAWSKDGLTVLAIAPITPVDLELWKDKPRNYLVLSKLIDQSILDKLGRTYFIKGMAIDRNLTLKPPYHTLKDIAGKPMAAVTWIPPDPGTAMSDKYAIHALIIVLSLLCFMLPLAIVHYRTLAAMDRSERQALQAARTDFLSGLANRVQLLELLEQKLGAGSAENVTLAFIDLDGFKAVNDTYDHETGDKLIRAFGAALEVLARDCSLTARLGGDEFAFVVAGPDSAKRAEEIASNIIHLCREPFDLDGRMASIGASIGLTSRGSEILDPAEFMRQADVAMYVAKDSGRNQYCWFNAALETHRIADMKIANEMRGYLEADTIGVAYQPVIDASSNSIVAVEALARWPGATQLAPDRFIPIAEEHGMIDLLCHVVLRTAIRQIAGLRHLDLSVNVSALQLNNKNLVPGIVELLAAENFAPERLELEFTETHLIRNRHRTKQVIAELQKAGIRVALDDFGTGYASVGYLRDFAFDTIKLDHSLAKSLVEGQNVQKFVQGTVLIACGLSANVVAEGIETGVQASVMRMLGANKLQGYYFGKPEPIGQLMSRIAPNADDAAISAIS